MTLVPGARLGVYEVTAQIGEGGMGQVFRARDGRLHRDVALKVLPDSFANDPDRLERFAREAQTLASLNHPNIAAIYGIEGNALVMELVEGEDLSMHIARGPMPIDECLPIARQIADALDAAHEQGIIHRDLKPPNIKVRTDGTVKVLDFGLAKALDANASGATAAAMNSPTLTARATQMGVILGTAAYMSPEQARGKSVDKRADIWAFGVVLYGMLSGQRAFKGDDISETLASVLKDTPSMDALPAGTPPRLARLIARCLDRDVKTRLRDIGEARIEIARIEAGVADGAALPVLMPPVTSRTTWVRVLPWALVATLTVALVTGLLAWALWRSVPAPTPRKLFVSIGADASLSITFGAAAILSPDATTLAFVAQSAGRPQLFIRKLDQLQAAALAGTEDAASPFFSPDGQWIAFFAGGELKKVSVTCGAASKLCDAPNGRGGAWTDDDTIIFTPEGMGPNATLRRVPAAGGAPAGFGTLGQGAATQRWPQALPGGTSVLYTEHSSTADFDGANLVVAPLFGGTPKIVVRGGYYGRYVQAGDRRQGGLGSPKRGEGGHLVYMNRGTLFAVRFDLDRLEAIGPAVPAIDGIATNSAGFGGAQLAVSSDGTLVYVPGVAVATASPISWLTRDGKTSAFGAAKADWGNPRFSPDGQTLAIEISDGKQRNIWVYAWGKDTLKQLTFDRTEDRRPVWTPDGRRIVFASDRAKAGTSNLYWVNADGTGEVARLTDSPDVQAPDSWHPSGKLLAFSSSRGPTGADLMILRMEGDAARGWTPGIATVFLSTPAHESRPMFSPDGRWIAYTSNEAGGNIHNVYVRPFPGPGGKWRISAAGGAYPRWSATAHELVFLDVYKPAPTVMVVPFAAVGDAFRAETPQVWSSPSPLVYGTSPTSSPYDVHPDGKRIAVAAVPYQSNFAQDHVVFVFNFAEYLEAIAPGKN